MSNPEDLIDPLPLYCAQDDNQSKASIRAAMAVSSPPYDEVQDSSRSVSESSLPDQLPDEPEDIQNAILKSFFDAISKKQDDVVALFLNDSLVTANTTLEGMTPLLAAVSTRSIRLVQQLVESGAEPDAFGVQSRGWEADIGQTETIRTPLQLAASLGHLPLVKLFMEVYHCDDGLVAPDGQIALRLAADNGHREVVDYLPSRRAGGFLRWQKQHQKSIRRTKKALQRIGGFVKFFAWDIEKFFLWTIPNHVIVKPLTKVCKYCWDNCKSFGPWCKKQAQQAGARIMKFIKAIPNAAVNCSKAVWKFGTETIPRCLRAIGSWLWKLLTKGIPTAIDAILRWIWGAISLVGSTAWGVITKTASLAHTIVTGIVTFFRNITLKDIGNGIVDVFRAVFVAFPKGLWSWICRFGEVSWNVLKATFGCVGECVWWVCCGIGYLVVYIPRKLWVVLSSLGRSFATAWHEVIVVIRPKA